MTWITYRKSGWALVLVILGGALYAGTIQAFVDEEGCLLCHKYPKMGRVTEAGTRRSYYVMPHVYGKTVHRNVPCRDCHTYIQELPHREVETGVTCNTQCHSIKNPANGKNFSHQPVYDAYQDSVHGRDKIAEGLEADKPYCITCHTNPVYNPHEDSIPTRVADRCIVCHEDREFVEAWYNHTSRRIREIKRSSIEIVALCSSCHADESLIERHMQAVAESDKELGKKFPVAAKAYEKSFHGKVTRYGFTQAANCLDCHAEQKNYYLSIHQLRPSRDPLSPLHQDRRHETCQRCHAYADENYAMLDPHPTKDLESNPFVYYAEHIYNWMAYVVIAGLITLALFETIGRRRDGVTWMLKRGSSWWRSSRKRSDRDRVT